MKSKKDPKNKNIEKNNAKGITLIALVITIIVLLILAGVSIAMLTGDNGIITQANKSKVANEKATAKEKVQVEVGGSRGTDGKLDYGLLEDNLNNIKDIEGVPSPITEESFPLEVTVDGYTVTIADNGTVTVEGETTGGDETVIVEGVKIPNGFYHVAGTSVETGLVISDVKGDDLNNTKDGNQYVWIPVTKDEEGNPTKPYIETNGKLKAGSDIEIQLGRYNFDDTTGEPSQYSGDYIEDDLGNDNAPALNINEFKNSVKENGGYYIGRYEAGVVGYDENNIETINSTGKLSWTGYKAKAGQELKLVCREGEQVWNYVTQNKASELCRNISTENGYTNVTSDLVNSYAWDTAIVYIQKCGTDIKYSMQTGKSTTSSEPSETGEAILAEGVGANKKDVQCNIYDMAGNCLEWSTETIKDSMYSCVGRGRNYGVSSYYASLRVGYTAAYVFGSGSFRPLLYL